MSKNGKSKSPYSFETFVKNWQKAATVADVMAATGLSRNTVSAMASRLRKEGVKIKSFPRRTARPVDVSTLNRIASENAPAKRA